MHFSPHGLLGHCFRGLRGLALALTVLVPLHALAADRPGLTCRAACRRQRILASCSRLTEHPRRCRAHAMGICKDIEMRGYRATCLSPADLPWCLGKSDCPPPSLCLGGTCRVPLEHPKTCDGAALGSAIGPRRCQRGIRRQVVACLGDSNTAARWPAPDTIRWCEMAATLVRVIAVGDGSRTRNVPTVFLNAAAGGATAADPGLNWPWAFPQLEASKAAGAEVVIAAFGTNDLLGLHLPPAELVAAYQRLSEYAQPRRFLVALTPPRMPIEQEVNAKIEEANDALRAAFPATQVLDFWSGFGAEDFEADGLHLNAHGQAKRAQVAARALGR
jgi:lysophospholipase L1-like esterase